MTLRLTTTVLFTALFAGVVPARADITLTETGSTLILPLFKTWAENYAASHPGVTLTTEGTGSAEGIDKAISGAVEVGTSDAYLSDDQASQHRQVIDVPMAISAVAIVYNLPDLKGTLKLDGPTLAGIYDGSVRFWDDKVIVAMNPDVGLTHIAIVPVHRIEGSGDTFVFTQYLSFATSPRDEDTSTVVRLPNGSWGDKIGYGTTVTWPTVQGAQDAAGNNGMISAIGKAPGSIGYVGVSFEQAIAEAKLGMAEVKSFSGEFLHPTPETIKAAAAALTPRTPDDERLTLVNAPGQNCYPLINYEYAIVSTQQKDAATAKAIRDFLLWAIAPDESNEKLIAGEQFVSLPPRIWVKSHDQIERIR